MFVYRIILVLVVMSVSALAQAPKQSNTETEAARAQQKPVIVPPRQIAVEDQERDFGGLVGATVFRLTIDATGAVSAVSVHETSGNPQFDTLAKAEVQRYRFEPATINGVPQPVQILFRFEVNAPVRTKEKPETLVTGRLRGTVFLKGTRRRLAGVLVRLKALEQETYTDEKGLFTFDAVQAGQVSIQIEESGFYSYQDKQEIRAQEGTEVTYYIEPERPDAAVVTVRAKRPQKEVTRRTIDVQEVVKIPGINGDVVKVVQNLPGVARIPFGGGGLIIRGSNPGDAGAVINGHFVPLIFHFGGIRSILPSELIERIDFYPGNYSVRYGRFSGGIVDLVIKRPQDEWQFRAEADVFDAGLYVSGPLGDRTNFAIAGRRSYIDALLPFAIPDDANLDLTVAPRYYDYQLLIDHKTPRHHAQFLLFGSDDALDFVLDEPINADPALRGDFENWTRFSRIYGRLRTKLTPTLQNEFSISTGPNQVRAQFGPSLRFNNNAWVVTARNDLGWTISDRHKLTVGLDFETYQATLDITAPFPPKEGEDRGQRLSSRDLITANRDAEILNIAGWVEHQYRPIGKRLLLVGGLRYDYDHRIESGTWDPRASVRLNIVPDQFTLKGGLGWFTQRPSPDESDPSFGNPNISAERSIHYSAGTEWRFNEHVELDVVGFYKDLYDLVATPVQPIGMASSTTMDGRQIENVGEGRSYGVEVLLRHVPDGNFFGWLSYTLMRSERLDQTTGAYRVFDFDQTHILTVLGQYKFNARWEFGARFRYVTGVPQTPYVGSIYNSNEDVYEPILGETNSVRLPSFQQLDLRIDRIWRFDQWMLNAYFEAQNIYNYQNVEGYQYDYDFQNKRPVTGLPIIPSFGLKGSF